MIYNDYVAAGGTGIISLLYQNQALNFLPADLITSLDRAYTRQNGEKTFADNIADSLTKSNNLTDVALELKSIYEYLWTIQYQAKPETLATSKTETADNGSIDTKNTIAGYDSDSMVDDTAINRTNSNNTTTTKTDYSTIKNVMEQLRKTNLWRTIKLDINNYLFITVYN